MKRFAVAAAILFACAGAASAQSSTAQASLTGYSYQLIDLDPDDGIAPSITFSNQLRGAVVNATSANGQTSEDAQWSESGEPVTAQLGQPGTGGAASFSADALTATSSTASGGHYFAIAGWDADYTLSAHTRLVVTGRAAGSLEVNGADTQQLTLAMVNVLFRSPAEFDGDAAPYLASYSRAVNSFDAASGTSFDEAFEVALVNDSSSALSATMSVVARTTAVDVSPVPEPATWLMLGSGLMLTAAAVHRRRRS